MEFRTIVKTAEHQGLLHHSDEVMLLGSCFSDNIGGKMLGAMMRASVNPVGTLFNPLSISAAVDRIIDDAEVTPSSLFSQNGVWNSFDFHSRFSMASKEATLQLMNCAIHEAHECLKRCSMLIITVGTAVVYRHKETGAVVANCHKVPQSEFTRGLASCEQLTEALTHIIERVHAFNSKVHITFTVSPVRHIADGLEMNSLSKALMRVAVGNVETHYGQLVDYFPAFEIVNDDLRDYRFYAPDMIHPSDVAIEYLWKAFQATYLDDASAQAVARCERTYKRLQHRHLSDSREARERFEADTRTVINKLVSEYPYLAENKRLAPFIDNK